MTLDERLRNAHQQRLREEASEFERAGSPDFVLSAGRNKPAMALLAAACLALVAFLSYSAFGDPTEPPEVRLDIASIPPEGGDDTSDGGGADPQRVAVDQVTPTATPEPTPTPTPRPSPTPEPSPTPIPTPTPEPESEGSTSGSDPTQEAAEDGSERGGNEPTDEATTDAATTLASGDGDAGATPTAVADGSRAPSPVEVDSPSATSVPDSTATAIASTPTVEPGTAPTAEATAIAQPTATPRPTITPTAAPDPTATAEPTPAAQPTAVATAVPTATPPPTATALPTPTPTATPIPTATAAPTASPTPEPTATPSYDAGTATTVCPSGQRASLEFASLRYTSSATGWGGLLHLVDEQNGPYYFQAWEPNYPNPVTVEVVLDQQVLASDIRVFQDPFTPVSGEVEIAIGSSVYPIALSGVDGWRVVTFSQPTVIDRFEISRDAVSENIMEVMICLAP